MKRQFLTLLFFLSIAVLSFAQSAKGALKQTNPSEVGVSSDGLAVLDGHIQKFVAEGSMPGGVFLIARKGKVIYYKNFGHRALDKKEAYEKDDIFRLASMTKAVTTVSIMQLFEQGKLGLDDPIFYYIPAFAQTQVLDTFNPADSSYTTVPVENPLTIRHLFYLPKDKHDRLIPIYTYNEQKQMVMADASTGIDPRYPTMPDNNHYAGGGGLSGTTMDYAKFIQTLCSGGTFNGVRILGRKTIDVMTSDQLIRQNENGKGFSQKPGLTYGLGFSLKTAEGQAINPKSPGTYEWGGAWYKGRKVGV